MDSLFLALLSGFAFALNNFLAKIGMEESNPSTAVAINVVINALGLWILAIFTSPIRPIFSVHVWPFLLAGIFSPGLARPLLFSGYQHLGLARSDVVAASMPLFAVLTAILVVGEQPAPQALLGTLFIVVGIGVLSYRREEESNWKLWTLFFPLGAALFFAFRDVSVKVGLQMVPFPVAGAAIAATVASIVVNLPYLFEKRRRSFIVTRISLIYLTLGGFCATVAYLTFFLALQGEMVSHVTPLVSIFPLFSVILGYCFLQSKEKVTWKVVVGGLLVVGGAVSILFR